MPLPIDENPFQWMKPSENATPVIEELRDEFRVLHERILKKVPACRERSLAITNLEQTAMWAIKAAVGRIP